MKITFEKIQRDCKHNLDLAAGRGPERNAIYDYNVLIDGEFRAVFKSVYQEKGFELWSVANDRIEIPRKGPTNRPNRPYFRGGERAYKVEFEAIIQERLTAHMIPTVAKGQAIIETKAAAHKALNIAKWERYKTNWHSRRLVTKADAAIDLLKNVDKSCECEWNKWLANRDAVLAYVMEPPPIDEAHMTAADIFDCDEAKQYLT